MTRHCRPAHVLLQPFVGHTITDNNLAIQDSADGYQYSIGRLLLHDVTIGSRSQRALRVDRFVVHGKNQDGQAGVPDA